VILFPSSIHDVASDALSLRTCSKPAVGHQTIVEIDLAGEGFSTQGLMITQRNWLDVYPWEKWGGNSNLPTFQVTIRERNHDVRWDERRVFFPLSLPMVSLLTLVCCAFNTRGKRKGRFLCRRYCF